MTEPTCKSGFTFRLPDYWTPDLALAIVEFIGDLREVIWVTTRSSWSRRIASCTHPMRCAAGDNPLLSLTVNPFPTVRSRAAAR